jgi:hypothetical protein
VNVILAENAAYKKDGSRQGAKAQRNDRRRSLLFFAPFAYFAALRETVFAVLRSAHNLESFPARKGVRNADLNAV